MRQKITASALVLFALFSFRMTAQDDLLQLADSSAKEQKTGKVYATFKATKVIDAQTTETVSPKTLDFNIAHRFGNIGASSNGGGHTLYGFDVAENIRFAFDYGLTDNLMIGVSRSKRFEFVEGHFKYRFITQTEDNKAPVSMAFYGSGAVSTQREDQFYSGTVNVKPNWAHRIVYASQLIIARKFTSRLSLEILPTYIHRNFVRALVNPDNNATEKNSLLALGFAGRFKITKRFSLVADYYYTLSDYRSGNSIDPYYAPLGLGVEIETGGHVFHINLTNSSGIIEQDYIPYTADSWLDGGFKFGFNISRVFYF